MAALERLKTASSDAERVAAITEGRLPHEVVTPFARSAAVWAAMVPQLPILALLAQSRRRSSGTACSSGARALVERKLGRTARSSAARRSCRSVSSRPSVTSQTPWLKDALRDALELAFDNVPELEGRTAVLLDRSGSMQSYLQTAAIFAVSLLKKAKLDGRLLLFDDRVEEMAVSLRDSVLTQARPRDRARRHRHRAAHEVSCSRIATGWTTSC